MDNAYREVIQKHADYLVACINTRKRKNVYADILSNLLLNLREYELDLEFQIIPNIVAEKWKIELIKIWTVKHLNKGSLDDSLDIIQIYLEEIFEDDELHKWKSDCYLNLAKELPKKYDDFLNAIINSSLKEAQLVKKIKIQSRLVANVTYLFKHKYNFKRALEIFREFEDPAYLSLTEDDFEKYNELPPRTISQQFSAETIKAIESGLFKDWGVWSFIVQDCPSIKEPFLLLSFINEYCRLFKYNSEDKKSISEDYLFTPLSKLKPNDSNRTLIKKLIEQQKKEKTSDYWKEYFIKCLNRILKNWEDD